MCTEKWQRFCWAAFAPGELRTLKEEMVKWSGINTEEQDYLAKRPRAKRDTREKPAPTWEGYKGSSAPWRGLGFN